MAVNLKVPESVAPVKGIRLSAVSAGIYDKSRLDLALIEISADSHVVAVFTKNSFCAAPVIIAKEHIKKNAPCYCLINAGNANAGTGEQGISDTIKICESLAELFSSQRENVLPFSTGVIGKDLPVKKITNSLSDLKSGLSRDGWFDAAKSIMTTDTQPKLVSKTIKLNDVEINISGISKGAGMIKPDMATMLAFIATDAKINKSLLEQILNTAVNKSFNRITVDGDTSTNDACVLIATGKAENKQIDTISSKEYQILEQALIDVFIGLAQAIVRDGEGAGKFIEIEVNGGESPDNCLAVAYNIAHSPLVKTAFTASDPNWGRILAAVGSTNIDKMDIDSVSIYLDELCIVEKGQRAKTYVEEQAKKHMLKEEIKIVVKLSDGKYKETIWTTDLSYDYIKINAEYRS